MRDITPDREPGKHKSLLGEILAVKSRVLGITCGVGGACLLLIILAMMLPNRSALSVLRELNAYNPIQLEFLVSFDVINESGEEIVIMPIGMVEGTERYGPLPRFSSTRAPAKPIDRREPISISIGDRATIVYDYDDINFRHILIRDRYGTIYIVDTDKKGNISSCYGPQERRYSVPLLKDLRHAPDELLPCFDGKYVRYSVAVEYAD